MKRNRDIKADNVVPKVYPSATIEHKLGMDGVRLLLTEKCVSEPARCHVSDMKFITDFAQIKNELEQTAEMVSVLEGERNLSLSGLTDTREWLSRIRAAGTFIDVDDLAALRRCMNIAEQVRSFFDVPENPYPTLGQLAGEMTDVRPYVRIINNVLTDNGIIKDNASPELRDIRSRLSTIQGRMASAMRRVLSRAVADGIVETDTQPSVRDGRLVLPVAAMNKRRINGIVHDESATGKTYFIEPAEVVELGNEQRELIIEERREIVKILTQTANLLRPGLPELATTFEILYRFDFIRAKALFAIDTGGAKPVLKDYPLIEWHDARHPLLRLNLEARGRSVVPLDIDLTEKTARILVVSGPNAGGKSVTLKTVGINQYMIQCGVLPVMDAHSRAGIFDGIFVDLGDDQSIEDDLSTYSSHLRNMKFILSHGNNRSLVLIDEFGAGTEPQIGGAIAQALLTEFNDKGMWGVVTTHYRNLKQLAQETPGMINGSMVYDRQLMQPTFKLAVGSPGSSFAVEIALRTGLPKSIIDRAESIVGSDYFNLDKYLLDINRDRRYWENKRNEIKRRQKHLEDVISRYEENAENLRNQRRVILDEAKTEAERILDRSNAAIEQTIRDIRRAQADKEETRALRRKLAEERQKITAEEPEENKTLKKAPRPKSSKNKKTAEPIKEGLALGDNVLLDNQGQPGQIIEIGRDKATVMFGLMKMTVPIDRLSRTMRKPRTQPGAGVSIVSRQTAEASRMRQLDFKNEIDVRGMRADEAVQAVTYFIDDALQFNAGRVRILHGTGTGALRMVIRQYLSTVSGVSRYHDEDVRFGGAGITVVEL